MAALTNCVFGIGAGEKRSSDTAGEGRSLTSRVMASSSRDGSSRLHFDGLQEIVS